jgi:RIMS-binding protein 2
MSPNPNAQQEELSFRKHQLIKVYGEADPDGFYYAEIGRRFGLVPSNMVIEVGIERKIGRYLSCWTDDFN